MDFKGFRNNLNQMKRDVNVTNIISLIDDYICESIERYEREYVVFRLGELYYTTYYVDDILQDLVEKIVKSISILETHNIVREKYQNDDNKEKICKREEYFEYILSRLNEQIDLIDDRCRILSEL